MWPFPFCLQQQWPCAQPLRYQVWYTYHHSFGEGGEEGRKEAETGMGREGKGEKRKGSEAEMGMEGRFKENLSLQHSTHLAHPSERSPYWCTWMACWPGVRPSTVPSTTHCSGVTCTILTSPLTPPPPCSIATAAPWWDEEGAVCVCVCVCECRGGLM